MAIIISMEAVQHAYDVAFSFLAQDEPLATELNDLLQDRLRTFLYSKRQGEIAGTDGELSFNSVFSEQARLVVVLYRTGWGQTPWTRIEETAIRNRGFEQGYEFVKFIPLDDSPTVPKWLPRTHLWLGLKRWGISGAASVIESRVQELGGEPREESATERAARLDRALQFATERENFISSTAGVQTALDEFSLLTNELERLVNSINEANKAVSLKFKTIERSVAITGLGLGLSITWQYRYINSLDDATLEVVLWDGHPPWPNMYHFDEPKRLNSERFTFDLLPPAQRSWVQRTVRVQTYLTEALASKIIKDYLNQADARRAKRRE